MFRPAMVATALLATALTLCAQTAPAPSTAPGGGARFSELLGQKTTAVTTTGNPVVTGLDGFYFLGAELRSYHRGEFWGPRNAERIALERWQEREAADQAAIQRGELKPEDRFPNDKPDAAEIARQDPLPAIVDFAAQCKKAGVELLVVPVPGKIALYPDKLDPTTKPDVASPPIDAAHQAFYAALAREGVRVLDLTPDMKALRAKGIDCHLKQDAHWSPAAAELAAARVAEALRKQPWFEQSEGTRVASKPPEITSVDLETTGDLVALLKDAATHPREKLTVHQVKTAARFVESDEKSPLVVMGDSHLLVYHDNLIASHAGFADHLAADLALPTLDILATKGSGASAPRLDLAQRKTNLAGKKAIVWLFTARDLTESFSGWQKIPVVTNP